MRGKYSPTVCEAYMKDQGWWDKYSQGVGGEWTQYDPEGYDSYGYDLNDVDRAGNHENDYYVDDYDSGNYKFNQAYAEWAFDGVKPIKVKL